MKLSKFLPFLIVFSLAFNAGWTPNTQLPVNQAADGWVVDPNVQVAENVQTIQAENMNAATLPSAPQPATLSPENATYQVGRAVSQAEYDALKQQAAMGSGSALSPMAPNVQIDSADLNTAAPGPLAPVGPGVSFAGPTQAATGGWNPPDSNLAVGPTSIVACVNSAFIVYSKTGTQLSNNSFGTWWSSSDRSGYTFIFDPICKYDQLSNRFIIVALLYNASPFVSKYLVSVSKDSSGTAGWWNYAFDATLDGSTSTAFWADFPDVGIDNSAIYITSNQFNTSNSFQYSKIRILNKTSLYSGTIPSWTDITGMTDPSIGGKSFSLRAAHNLGANDTEYFVDSLPSGGSQLSLYKITNPLTSPTFFIWPVGTTVNAYSLPPNADQLGTTTLVDTGDTRLLNAVYRNGYLWTAHTISDGGSPAKSCFRWYQLNPASGSVVQQGTFCSGSAFYFYPAVTVDASGNMGVTFSYSSSTVYPTMKFTGRLTTTAVNTLEASNSVVSGLGPHTSGRWGDYGGAAMDPDGSAMWFIHEFGGSTVTDWRTQIFSATYGTIIVSIGGTVMGNYNVQSGQSLTLQYGGINAGPVHVMSTNNQNMFPSERSYYSNSYNEIMGYPGNQLTTDYWFTWYDDVYGTTWLLVGNPNNTTANVDVYISSTKWSYSIPAGQSITPRYGINAGPVHVVSTNGVSVFTSERAIYSGSFNEVMGYAANKLTTDYWFTWYDDFYGTTWLLVGNPSNTTANVDVYIGSTKWSYSIPAGQSITPRYGINAGPVHVVSTNGVSVFTSERAIYSGSFNEVMGYPGNQLTTDYWFPWYDDVNNITWLLVGNPTTTTANVDVYISSTKWSYSIPAGQSITPRYGINAGPVRVVSTNGVNVFTSQRTIYKGSFDEVLGFPANQLTTDYWFTWYDDVYGITKLLIGRP